MKLSLTGLLIIISVGMFCGLAGAEEGLSGHYFPGTTSSFIDMLPDSGTSTFAYVNSFTYYHGSTGASRNLQLGGLVAANVKGTVYADTSVFLYQAPWTILGGQYGAALAVPYQWMKVTANLSLTTRRGRIFGLQAQGTDNSFGDIELLPLMFGWEKGDLLIVALRGGRNTDAITLAFMMAATLWVVERRLRALVVTLLVGVLFREAVLFVIPFAYAIWATRVWDKQAAKQTILLAVPALGAFIALHLAIPSVGRDSVPGYGGSLIGQRLEVIESGLRTLPTELRRMFTVYGPLWFAAPLALASSRFARRGLVLVACSLVSMTFALDWGRMLLLSAPAFYPAGADTLTRHPRWRTPALFVFALLILGYAIYMDRSGVQHGIIESPPPPYPVR